MKIIQKEFNKKPVSYCKCPTCGHFYKDDVLFVHGSINCPNCNSCMLRGLKFWERFSTWGLLSYNIVEERYSKVLIEEVEDFTGFKAIFNGAKIEWIAGNITGNLSKWALLKALNDPSGKGFDLVVKELHWVKENKK